MGGTIVKECANCETPIDYDPLLGGKQYCDDCEALMKLKEAGEEMVKTFKKLVSIVSELEQKQNELLNNIKVLEQINN